MRAFLALPVPDATAGALVALQAALPFGRPVPEENLHLTLAFLGDVPGAVLEALDEELSLARLPAPGIGFTRLGTFAEIERGLIFAEVETTPVLSALQARVASAARAAGAHLPRRRFRPHVTLMRAGRQPRGPARDRVAAALGMPCDVPGFVAERVVLYASHLGPDGAVHKALADYPLAV